MSLERFGYTEKDLGFIKFSYESQDDSDDKDQPKDNS